MSRKQKRTADKLRFVLDPQGRVVFDLMQTLPSSTEITIPICFSAVRQACENGQFLQLAEHAQWTDDLPERVEQQMRKQLLGTLHLLRRSGALISGFDKVKAALENRKVALLVQAGDASVDGRAKVANLARNLNVENFQLLCRDELAFVTGNVNQVHLAVLHGGLADHFQEAARKLEAYMTSKEPQNTQGTLLQ